MKKQLTSLMFAILMGATPVFAVECGESPVDQPAIPNGSTAVAETIRTARNAVVAYSTKVDDYLACMDQRATVLLPYMTKKQKLRWDEDLSDLHDARREVQNAMNLAIRTFRKAQQ